MTDYLKKYQQGGEIYTDTDISDKYISTDLAHVEPKVKSIMGGLSKTVFEDSNIKDLDTKVNGMQEEMDLRSKGEGGNSRYQEYSDEKLSYRHSKLKAYLGKEVDKETKEYSNIAIKYLQDEKGRVDANSKYTPEDMIKLEGFFDKKIREWSQFSKDIKKDNTVSNVQKIMAMKEIGYSTDIESHKNGGKLIPKLQNGSMLSDDYNRELPTIENQTPGLKPVGGFSFWEVMQAQQDSKMPSEGYKAPVPVKSGFNTDGIPVNGFGSPTKSMGSYITPRPVDLGTNKTYDPNLGKPELNTFGNQTDRSFSNDSTTSSSINKPPVTGDDYVEGPIKPRKMLDTNGPVISRTGINTPIGGIQFNDILQYIAARKAYRKPVAVAPVHQEEFTSSGSRNVQSISGIDSSIRNKSANNIASIGGKGYQGSDPIMNMIANTRIAKAKSDAKSDFIGKEAIHLENEKVRYARESEEQRKQVAADRVANTKVQNANELAVAEGKWKTAQSEVAREAQWAKNKATIFSAIQGRWNADSKQRNTAKAAMWKQDRDRKYDLTKQMHYEAGVNIGNKKYAHNKAKAARRLAMSTDGNTYTKEQVEADLSLLDESYNKDIAADIAERDGYYTELNGMTNTNSEETLRAHDASKESVWRWGRKDKEEKTK